MPKAQFNPNKSLEIIKTPIGAISFALKRFRKKQMKLKKDRNLKKILIRFCKRHFKYA